MHEPPVRISLAQYSAAQACNFSSRPSALPQAVQTSSSGRGEQEEVLPPRAHVDAAVGRSINDFSSGQVEA
jgi:hypothetical protein